MSRRRVDVARVGSVVSLEVGGDYADLSPARAREIAAQLMAAAGPPTAGPFQCETARQVERYDFGNWHSHGGYIDEPDGCC